MLQSDRGWFGGGSHWKPAGRHGKNFNVGYISLNIRGRLLIFGIHIDHMDHYPTDVSEVSESSEDTEESNWSAEDESDKNLESF